MNQKRGFLSIILAVAVGIILVIGGGILYYQKLAGTKSISQEQIPSLVATSTSEKQVAPPATGTREMSMAGSVDSRNDFGCFPPSCSVVSDPFGRQICENWKAGKATEWPPDCNYLPTAGCKQLCTVEKRAQSQHPAVSQPAPGSKTNSPTANSQFSSQTYARAGDGTSASASALSSCPSDNVLFDRSPLNADDLSGIEPLGHMNGEHILPNQADHVYLIARSSGATTVYAPGNATILQVIAAKGLEGADAGMSLYTVFFSPCKSVMFAFQMNGLSSQIADAISKLQPTSVQKGSILQNTVYANIGLSIKSGDELGTITGSNGFGGEADFAAADVRTIPLAFIDQGEATGMLSDSYLHAVCPLDYFNSALKSTLYGQLTIKNAGANGIPACGATMQDKASTAQGNWYHKDTSTPTYQGIDESALLAIAHSNLDPTQGVISVGTDLIPSPMLGTQIVFQPKNSGFINREPSQIAPDGNVYCFEGQAGAGGHGAEGHVDIRLDNASKLEADFAEGACAANPSLQSPVIYVR